ncbi:MAG: ribonuclease H-like domain-containing protein [Atribacterota bacterium]|jgi:hypothetical protein|nr:ribonuclease H-like domain-containing protein [Atribacterota bacterium]MDD4896227.1 ribonuclease H-like domain-containing protein [Atribacterota bacterium]MDD5637298.1 ribonuclease H-like domain-containing protein [Atribacterota bacterium]
MDLRNRLEKIESLKKRVQQINNAHQKKSDFYSQTRKTIPISEVIPGNAIDTPHGSCFFTEKTFPLETSSYGDYSLLDMQKYFPSGLHFWIPQFKSGNEEIKLEEILFFDTETTGLAGGSGTYIFLLGLGYFKGENFYIRQYFMSDYHEEEALLWAVNQLFAQDFKLLVSYNGKSYDFPLLQTRYIMTRLPLQLNTSYHLDLLFPTRRLWKRRLQDCSLANIEKKILKIYREEDIPGYLIPHVYFRYLQDKDSRSLKPIFTHNLQDIISLVLLTTKISQTLDDPLSMGKFALDLCSIGKIYEGYKDFQYSSKCYEEALKGNLSDEETLDALKLCSFAYKRQGEWEKAEVAWREIISLNGQFNLYPYEELAKYYEHKLKDYQQAGAIVEEALQRLTKENISWSIKEQWQNSLYFRLERIKRKQRLMSANSKDNQGE